MSQKKIITLSDYLISELIKNGYNFYKKNNQIVFYEKENQLIRKIISYDEQTKEIAQNTIFFGFDFLPQNVRENFEKIFLSKFYNRAIKFQTIEMFIISFYSLTIQNKDIIISIFDNEKFLSNKNTSQSNNSDNSTSRDNSLNADLPQTQTNISLDIDSMEYATDTHISKHSIVGNSSANSTQNSYNFDNVTKLSELSTQLFEMFDKKLFSFLY